MLGSWATWRSEFYAHSPRVNKETNCKWNRNESKIKIGPSATKHSSPAKFKKKKMSTRKFFTIAGKLSVVKESDCDLNRIVFSSDLKLLKLKVEIVLSQITRKC